MKANLAQRGLHLGGAVRGREVVKRRIVLERFADGEERVVITGSLRDIGEPWWKVVPRYLFTEPGDAAFVWAEQSGETEQQCRLSGARSAHESDDFTGVHIKRDVAQSRHGRRARFWSGVIGLV